MIIARRTLHVTSARAQSQIEIRIFMPEERDGCWRCDYEIDWPTQTRRFAAAGHDSVQALSLALKMIGSEIVASTEYQAGDISLDGNYRGCGFPVAHNIRDCLRDDDVTFE